jgi:endonuclease/exonuclease/phosphatase family metal-dependent hydrolase
MLRYVLLLCLVGPLMIANGCRGDPMNAAEPGGDSLPSVWLGTAPFCAASPDDCEIFGLGYVCSHRSGDGLTCLCGEKVLCRVPTPAQNPPRPDSLTAFTLVQYNILDRPYIVGHEGQRERMCRVPQALGRLAAREHIDAIVFNESFSGVCVPGLSFRDMLAYYGWRHALPTISAPILAGGRIILSNGGIFIASRWPILAAENMIYRACSGSDCLAAKGVQYAKIQKTVDGRSKIVHVFGTHLQGYRGTNVAGVRRQQLHELAEFVKQKAIPADEPVLLAGDFNIRGPSGRDFQDLVDTLRVSVPPIIGGRMGTMDVDNTLFSRGPWWVDYVLPSAVHQQPNEASMEAVALKTDGEFAICDKAMLQPFYVSPRSSTCTRTLRVRDLSDHYPVIARFAYPH